jgi:hypothetical protein
MVVIMVSVLVVVVVIKALHKCGGGTSDIGR